MTGIGSYDYRWHATTFKWGLARAIKNALLLLFKWGLANLAYVVKGEVELLFKGAWLL